MKIIEKAENKSINLMDAVLSLRAGDIIQYSGVTYMKIKDPNREVDSGCILVDLFTGTIKKIENAHCTAPSVKIAENPILELRWKDLEVKA